jgi:hypothetical protein
MAVFWDVAPCSLVEINDVSEVPRDKVPFASPARLCTGALLSAYVPLNTSNICVTHLTFFMFSCLLVLYFNGSERRG